MDEQQVNTTGQRNAPPVDPVGAAEHVPARAVPNGDSQPHTGAPADERAGDYTNGDTDGGPAVLSAVEPETNNAELADEEDGEEDEAPASLRDYLPGLPWASLGALRGSRSRPFEPEYYPAPALDPDYEPASEPAPEVNHASRPARRSRRWRRPGIPRWELIALAVILLVGAYFRFVGLDWDQGEHLHPDERFLTMVEGAIRPGLTTPGVNGAPGQFEPAGLLDSYFDSAHSALNPHNVGYGFFVYGTFPLFAMRVLAGWLHMLDYGKVQLLGRAMSGVSDLITVFLTYLIGRRLYGSRVGLLAAALLATCVMHIQQAHFFVFDSFLVTLVVASFYFCIDIAETGRWRSFALAGFFLGLSLATKLSMVVFVPIIALAGLIYLWRRSIQERGLGPDTLREVWENGLLVRIVGGGILALVVAGLCFRVFQPYAFAGPHVWNLQLNPKWLDNISYQAKTQDGTVDLPPSIQWAGTEPLLFPWRHMVAWGFGIPVGLVVWAGFAAATALVLWRGNWRHLLVVAWAGLCFVYFASVLNKTMRYLLPAYPFFILLGAWALVALYQWAKARQVAAVAAADGLPANATLMVAGGKPPRYDDEAELLTAGDEPPPYADASPGLDQDGVSDEERAQLVGASTAFGDRAAALRRRIAFDWQGLVARYGATAALALGAFVVVASTAWAFAFTRIYTRPTTRVAASLWIYQNLPKGTVMVNEHWDDPIPVPIPNYDPGQYRGPRMSPDALPLYDPDEPKKIDTIVQLLTASDFINVTSNRLYKSIPRIPQRYPMATEYYRALFAGDLGFKLVKTFASYPQLGPWVINDDRAEEAFTVYDHPKVLLFQKQPDFSPEKVRRILSAVPLDNVQQITPVQVGKPDLMLTPQLRAADTAGGTWADSFNENGFENRIAPLLWWIALEVMGLLMAPLAWRLFRFVPDRGYGVTKGLGLLAVSWLAWSLSGYRLLPWTRLTIVIAIGLIAVGTAFALRRWGAEWLQWMRDHRRLVLTSESVFLAAFVLFTLIRAFNPDLWHPARGGEKPMEFSYLNAVIKTAYFPPYDPWYAGGYLNYYYYGYVLVAALCKLTGVLPSISFNLAVAALYAIAAAGAFSFVYNLSRLGGRVRFSYRAAIAAGIAGWILLAFAGNLDGFSQLIERLAHAGQVATQSSVPVWGGIKALLFGIPETLIGGRPLEQFDFWRSSRIIPNNTINEFPFWTFLFSDLHAHLISIPFQALTLGWLLNLAYSGVSRERMETEIPVLRAQERERVRGRYGWIFDWLWPLIGWQRVVEIGVTAWLVGALYVINTWEFPTYLLLAAATFLIAEFTAQRGLTLGGMVRAVLSAGAVFALAKPLYRPFWHWYLTFYQSVTPWTADKSLLHDYLTIHGVFIFLLITFLVLMGGGVWWRTGSVRYLRARWRWLGAWDRFSELEESFAVQRSGPAAGYLLLISVTLALVLALLLRGLPLIAMLVALLAGCIAAAWERRESPALLLACLLAATGCALGIFVEFFALQGDIGRMNTVFKFYLQTWVMWSLVSAAALAWATERILGSRAATAVQSSRFNVQRGARGPLLFEEPAFTGTGDGDAGVLMEPVRLAGHAEQVREGQTIRIEPRTLNFELSWWQWAWLGGAAALVLAALAFPLGAIPARLSDRFQPLPPTLDGMAYMQYATVTDASSEVTANNPGGAQIRAFNDYDAIRWMQDNIKGSPVILEASIPEYRWGTRVAKYTGLPAVLGWRWHQAQQRGTYAPQVDARLRDVQMMFNDPSPTKLLPLLAKYRVRYIYVGDLERAYFSAAGIAKFAQMPDTLRPVYDHNGVTIYEVTLPATGTATSAAANSSAAATVAPAVAPTVAATVAPATAVSAAPPVAPTAPTTATAAEASAPQAATNAG